MTTKLPTEAKTFQFESAHSTVQFTVAQSKAGEAKRPHVCPRLYVQSIDDYGFQRELSVQRVWRHDPSTEVARYYWESHVYQHPGRREVSEVSERVARAFVAEFLHMCAEHPALLFNEAFWRADCEHTAATVSPRNFGFVHLCERLHRGAALSATLL